MRILLILLSLFVVAQSAQSKEQPDSRKVYIFGNSLIHHLTPTDETTMPHWLHLLAKSGGKTFTVNGQWGFLRNFHKELPPKDQWSFKQAQRGWRADRSSFAKSKINAVMVNPANFIQYQAADLPYEGDNPDKQSPLGAGLALFDKLDKQKPGQNYYIYEGWADMGSFAPDFPPDNSELAKYHDYNKGAYHDWYIDYLKRVRTERPKINITLIPVASTLSKLFTQPPLSEIKVSDLYSDNAPHGTANTYFLAAMITYSALYGEPAPKAFTLPDNLHPLIGEHFAEISKMICKEISQQTICVDTNAQ